MANSERRWIILSDDGRHVTIGRHTDPTPDEIARSGDALKAIGSGGWLAVMEGVYYGRRPVRLMQVSMVAPTAVLWDSAVEAFRAIRERATVETTKL